MPFTKFTNLDFDQIRTSIKDYLRANSDFTDFDFEGSNFSLLLDTLAYNTYITAFNSNMIVNESFLDTATIRENVVSLARNIGYVPRSKSCSQASLNFSVTVDPSIDTLTLEAGLCFVGRARDTAYIFSIPENVTTTVDSNGLALFGTSESPLIAYQGTFLKKQYVVDGSLDQRFIIENAGVDTATLVVYVKGPADSGLGREYQKIDNILSVTRESETFLIQEVQDEKYELLFGDGFFGKKLEDGSIITATYIITDGKDGNGASNFNFSGTLRDGDNKIAIPTAVNLETLTKSSNGGDIESISSIKYFAPRLYSAQYRAVTARDYEAIIPQIYPNTESVSVIGGEELSPPQFGKVLISIKPKNGTFISDFDKKNLLSNLKNYTLSGINQEIIDLKILFVEIESAVYYNAPQVSNVDNLKSSILSALTTYSSSVELNKFGGRFKYSKLLSIIDNVDRAITSNITKVKIRRNLNAELNAVAQYELCFGNEFHINRVGKNIKSTGFYVEGFSDPVYLTDLPNLNADGNLDGSKKGIISVVRKTASGEYEVVFKSSGTIDYKTGEINLTSIIITGTERENGIVEIEAIPESNDVVGLKDLYLSFSVSNSTINMTKDVIASGEEISGVSFTRDYYTSSYSNGTLERK